MLIILFENVLFVWYNPNYNELDIDNAGWNDGNNRCSSQKTQ